MSALLQVRHLTGYRYEGEVTASYNEARMTPVTAPGQLVLGTRLDVSPTPWSYRYRDYWGCQVAAFEIHEPHGDMTVTATSTVKVDRQGPRPALLSWDQLSDPRVADQLCEFVDLTPRVDPGPDLAALTAEVAATASGPTELGYTVAGFVHDEVRYVTGSTEVHGTARDAWAERQGVCQDLAHLCIGALRSAGVPARYVSGYLHPSVEPEIDVPVTGESHAWLEWWDGDWMPFDPTNQTAPDDRYVVVGAGRDYADVAPLQGIFSGGATSAMFVEVEITRTG